MHEQEKYRASDSTPVELYNNKRKDVLKDSSSSRDALSSTIQEAEVPQEFINELNKLLKAKGSGRVSEKGEDGSTNELVDANTRLVLKNERTTGVKGEECTYRIEHGITFSFETQKWTLKTTTTAWRNSDKKQVQWDKAVPQLTKEEILKALQKQ